MEEKIIILDDKKINAKKSKIKKPSNEYQKIINEANKQIEIAKQREAKALVKARTFFVK